MREGILHSFSGMQLFWDLHRITRSGQPFYGFSPTAIIVLLQHVRKHLQMRFTHHGQPESESLRKLFEQRFREHFNLSGEQYDLIVDVFDRTPIEDIPSAIDASLLPPVHNSSSPATEYLSRSFKPDETSCCGRALRARWIWATVYTKEASYGAWNITKTCRHGCGTRYFFDRRVVPGSYFGGECSWHIFRAWDNQTLPDFIATKSGRSIFCRRYIEHVTIELATTRYAEDEAIKVDCKNTWRLPHRPVPHRYSRKQYEAWTFLVCTVARFIWQTSGQNCRSSFARRALGYICRCRA